MSAPRPALAEPGAEGPAKADPPIVIERSPAASAAVSSWTAELAVPAVRRGEAVLSGRLVRSFERREPFANVELVLEEPAFVSRATNEDLPLEEWLRTTAERELARRTSQRRATSDARGEFRFEGLPANQAFLLRAAGGDLRLELESGGSLYGLEPQHLGEIRALELALVEFELARADGGALPRARLAWSSDLGGTASSWTANDRQRAISVGTVEFEARTEDGAWISEKRRVELVRGPQRVALRLEPRPALHGRFAPRDAGLRRGLAVHMIEASSGSATTETLLAASDKLSLGANTQYRFSFAERAPGRYALAVFSGSQAVSEVAIATLEANPCEVVLHEIEPAEQHLLRVVVEAPAGVDLGHTAVYAGALVGERGLEECEHLRRAEDGAYLVAEPALPEGASDARGYVRVRCTLGEQTVFYEHGAASEVRVAFDALAHLVVELVGFSPAELTRITLGLRRVAPALPSRTMEPWARPTAEDDPPSLAPQREKTALQPGSYELAVLCLERSARGFAQQWPLLTRNFELAPGTQRLELARPALHELVVQLPPGEISYRCALHWPGDGGRTITLAAPDAERRVRFELIPAGRYRLVCRPKGGAEAAIEVDVPSVGPVRAPE
ncbi:MAG: hypothetical protein JNM84_25640 [Planctomycetes bacterium]|nr:hypothetical protein [Planctomycetota bacterium]